MNIYIIMGLITGAIFNDTLIITPAIVAVYFFKIKLYRVDNLALIRAINTVLLLGAVLYPLTLLTEGFVAYYAQGEYEQYVFANKYSGPYWFYGLTAIVIRILLPQILWVPKFRKSVLLLVFILGVWLVLNNINPIILFYTQQSWSIRLTYAGSDLLKGTLIYLILLVTTYFILIKKSTACLKGSYSVES